MKTIKVPGKGNEYLYTPVDSEIIWIDRFKKGFKRIQQSLKTKNTIEARILRDELFAEIFSEKPKESKKVVKLAGERWLEWESTKKRKSFQTTESIKYSGKHLLPHITGLYAEQITTEWWENIYIPAKREEKKDRKFFNEWKWLTSFLVSLHRNGLIDRLPKLENPDPPRAEGLNLEDSELDALYEFGSEDLRLQLDLGFKHFMRRSEVLLLPFAEINFRKGFIDLPAHRTKIRKARKIPLNDDVIEKLKARKSQNGSPFVFPSPRDIRVPIGRLGNQSAWESSINKANEETMLINPCATFHDLRHSGLSRAFVATNRYAEICVVAGLSLEEAMKTYLHFKPENISFVSNLVTTKKDNGRQ